MKGAVNPMRMWRFPRHSCHRCPSEHVFPGRSRKKFKWKEWELDQTCYKHVCNSQTLYNFLTKINMRKKSVDKKTLGELPFLAFILSWEHAQGKPAPCKQGQSIEMPCHGLEPISTCLLLSFHFQECLPIVINGTCTILLLLKINIHPFPLQLLP